MIGTTTNFGERIMNVGNVGDIEKQIYADADKELWGYLQAQMKNMKIPGFEPTPELNQILHKGLTGIYEQSKPVAREQAVKKFLERVNVANSLAKKPAPVYQGDAAQRIADLEEQVAILTEERNQYLIQMAGGGKCTQSPT